MGDRASPVPATTVQWGGVVHGTLLLLVFGVFEAGFMHYVAGMPWRNAGIGILLYALMYTVIYGLVFHGSLLRITLGYLLLPYALFAFGWLTPWLAGLLMAVLLFCAWQVPRASLDATPCQALSWPWERMLAFCLIVAWVHLSGAGGVGFQTDDHEMHNGRLRDLIEYAWPVRYGEDQNLVYYIGYYLPAAIVGKLSGLEIAYQALYGWTVLGVALVFRWLMVLARMRFALPAAVLLIAFSGMDIIGYWINNAEFVQESGLLAMNNTERLNSWPYYLLHFFIGSYPSNTFQLYWAPHQSIAAWLVSALLLHAFFAKSYRFFGLFFALLALWSPLTMLAGVPLFIMLVLAGGWRAVNEVFSKENMLSGCVIVLVFVAFYFAGSAAVNPRAWLWNAISIKQWWLQLLLFYGLSWGALALSLWPAIRNMGAYDRRGFYVVVLALWLLSLLWYGLFSDMMVRGSALLMFAFMVYVALALHRLCAQRRWLLTLPIVAILCVGAMSSFWNVHDAVRHYDVKRQPVRAPDHPAASQFLGPDDTFFQKYLAAPQ